MDEELKLLIESKFAEQSDAILAQVNSTLNGFEAKQKRLAKTADVPTPPVQAAQESDTEDTYSARIQELETKLAEKEVAETQSKKAAAVSEYVSRHQYSEEFGEFYLLKYSDSMELSNKGIRVDGKPLEESLQEFASGKGKAFVTTVITTAPAEDGSATLMHTEKAPSNEFDANAFLSTLA